MNTPIQPELLTVEEIIELNREPKGPITKLASIDLEYSWDEEQLVSELMEEMNI